MVSSHPFCLFEEAVFHAMDEDLPVAITKSNGALDEVVGQWVLSYPRCALPLLLASLLNVVRLKFEEVREIGVACG